MTIPSTPQSEVLCSCGAKKSEHDENYRCPRYFMPAWDTRTPATQADAGDAGDAIDFALGHCSEPVMFLEDWRTDGAREWDDYGRWLKRQRDGAITAIQGEGA